MKLSSRRTLVLLAFIASLWPIGHAAAQGVTTGSITGVVTDAQKQPVPGVSVSALHEPSGTRYEATTRADGRFSIPGMRVGGPYTITASLTGFQPNTTKGVHVTLGSASDLEMALGSVAVSEEVTVSPQTDSVFSSSRTGAATAVSRDALALLPTISDRINDYARLSPQYSGGPFGGSFAGQDNRLNNITVDGSYFNNSFGLAGQPGDRTGVAPISTAAIEQLQVNVAPYDVRQGNFVGAGVNMVTRSGGNDLRGILYYGFRDNGLVGTEAKAAKVDPGTFDYKRLGGWASGPVLKNKLFFFLSFESDTLSQPGTTFRANTGGQTVGGNTTRVLASDLDQLSTYLKTNFNYDTGPYQGYDSETPAKRYLGKLDYNLNDRNKLSLRYTQLDSNTDVLLSNSTSLGFGNRRSSTTGLNFQNSNYQIMENIRSIVGEWNSLIGSSSSNSFIAGFTHQDESRNSRGSMFPMVDILDSGSVYTTFGFEPFTPNNELRYNTYQFQDNFTMNRGRHVFTVGASAERYESENVFFSGSQGIYVYNSLPDFYADANDYLANPNRTTSPVTLNKFQVSWMNIPGMEKPVQPLKVWYTGVYAQDEWQLARGVKVTYGLRLDVPFFENTAFDNADADKLTFRDENGNAVQYNTGKLPGANVLWSPRAGFNWDVTGDRKTQVRGGSGVFTGPPAYVWISNQVGNTGVLTGSEQLTNTKARPFNPNPDAYKPTVVTGAPASSFALAVTDESFKFPQVWRSNLALDQKLPLGIIGTVEGLYTRDVNGVSYINANLPAADKTFAGADARPRWTNNRINANLTNAIVLKNESQGSAYHISAALEKTFKAGNIKGAYSYGQSKNTVDAGSVASGSWTGNQISGDPNLPPVAYSSSAPAHRVFLAGWYRLEYFNFGATTLSLFWQGNTAGNASYSFSADLNGDGATNDLIHIARDTSEMNFQTYTSGGRTYTAQEQAAAWDAFIQRDGYLSKHRGEYAQRNAVFLPMIYRADISITQDIFKQLGGKRHGLQFRIDILNVSNLLNKDWGVNQRLVTTTPLIVPTAAQGGPVDAQGKAQYRLRLVNNEYINHSLEPTADINDVYRIQFSLKYSFN